VFCAVFVIGVDFFHKIFQRIAQTVVARVRVVKFVNYRTHLAGDFGSFIGAIMGNNENCQKILGIVLFFDTVDTLGDDALFVSCSDYNRVFEFLVGVGEFFGSRKESNDCKQHIVSHECGQNRQNYVEDKFNLL